jgi:hypothetical protein
VCHSWLYISVCILRLLILKVHPQSAEVETLACAPPTDYKGADSGAMCRLVGALSNDLPVVLIHAEKGRELLLVDCTEEQNVARVVIDLPGDFVVERARILGSGIVLLYCGSLHGKHNNGGVEIVVEVDFYGGIPASERGWHAFHKNKADVIGTSNVGLFFKNIAKSTAAWPADASSLVEGKRIASPPLEHFKDPMLLKTFPVPTAGGYTGSGEGDADASYVHMSADVNSYTKFVVGMENVDQRVSRIMGYVRSSSQASTIAELVGKSPAEGFCAHSVSCAHLSSRSMVQVVSVIGENRLAVEHGVVLCEIVSPGEGHMREIPLTKFPGLGLQGVNLSGNGTGGSLANRGLKVTTGAPQPPPKEFEMPSCIACCETSDGRVALLFSDAHVRVLEIRQDKLAVQEALFTNLTGQSGGSGAGQNMRGATSQTMDEFANHFDETDDVEDDDDEDEDGSDHDDDHEREGSGKNGRGSSGKGKGANGKGEGKNKGGTRQESRQKQVKREAKVGATEVLAQARRLATQAADSQRSSLNMSNVDEGKYAELYATVENEINQLRVVLQSVEATEKERSWLRGKTSGELDDSRIVDLAIGEKNVYKKRGQKEEARLSQRLPKRMSFVVDVSGSMAYFNGDQRLDRLCATVVMLMESLSGLDHKYQYEIVGHSGETHCLPLVHMGRPPNNRVERLAVIQTMIEHAATCSSGDNTLASSVRSVREVKNAEADDYFVFLISDANIEIYGVTPEVLADALMNDKEVRLIVTGEAITGKRAVR